MRLRKFTALLFFFLVLSSSACASDVYDSEPSFSPYYAGSVKSSVLYDAHQEVNYIRWLVGVPSSVTLDSEFTRKAQHGAVLLDAIDTLTHTPGRPSDMDTSFYELGYNATSHGNIAVAKILYSDGREEGNMTLSYSTKLYMDDSDESNISALGHRRWLMNPGMTRTGFGISTRKGYAVTYVIDESGSSTWPIADEFITWPANKHPHPLTYFDAETAWSVILNNSIFSNATTSAASVTLTRVSDGRTWNFTGSGSDGYYTVNTQGYGSGQCIIFRPSGVSAYNSGETWQVRISGLTRKNGGNGTISFSVTFTSETTGYEEERPSTGTYSRNDGSTGGGCSSGGAALLFVCVLPMALGIQRRKYFCAGR